MTTMMTRPPIGTRDLLEHKAITELRGLASLIGLHGYQRQRKEDLVASITKSVQALEAEALAQVPAVTAERGTVRNEVAVETPKAQATVAAPAPVVDVRALEQLEAAVAAPAARTVERGRGRTNRASWRNTRLGTAAPSGGRVAQAPSEVTAPVKERPTSEVPPTPPAERLVPAVAPSAPPATDVTVVHSGVLAIRKPEGYGILHTAGYLPSPKDVHVPANLVRRFGLRTGDLVEGPATAAREEGKLPSLMRVELVNGLSPEKAQVRSDFADLTPIYPNERLNLEHSPAELTTRIINLMCPIGKGQRGLIVAPPKAGKTTILKQIANAVSANHPEVHLIILLTDERPEEVTDLQRTTKAEVIASTFDRPSTAHCQIAELTIERAKRLVEYGHDVMILLDGITRLSRAYNLATTASGKILSGGVDASALYPPKRFFGAARNVEGGGSLTILATALVDTGSRMDEVIFEEFKGTGNMEVRLDRRLAERRVFPALSLNESSTRKEDLLLSPEELVASWKLRHVLGGLDAAQGLTLLTDKMRVQRTNGELVRALKLSGR